MPNNNVKNSIFYRIILAVSLHSTDINISKYYNKIIPLHN